jgi:tetratricopeptide (TPR) repeat protein
MKACSLALLSSLCLSTLVYANPEEAKIHYQKGLSYYGVGKFAEAAAEYEKAFELNPDPAHLYNAAQTHRAAGNNKRALLLYQNYLRLFDNAPNRAQVERHIAQLKQAIETDERAQGAPPLEPMSPEEAARKSKAAAEAPRDVVTNPADAKLSTRAAAPRPHKSRAWVWGVVAGGVAAAALGIGLGVGLGTGGGYPAATFGTARVH